MAETPRTHDIIVIGGSAGALETLRAVLRDLPADLPAAVFVVMHLGTVSYLAPVLERESNLPVVAASNGEPIERGNVYVAVPGMHLLIHDGHILLRRGPRENLVRPAIDPLFRSAAASLRSASAMSYLLPFVSSPRKRWGMQTFSTSQVPPTLMLRRPRSGRLEAWPRTPLSPNRNRDTKHVAMLRDAPFGRSSA